MVRLRYGLLFTRSRMALFKLEIKFFILSMKHLFVWKLIPQSFAHLSCCFRSLWRMVWSLNVSIPLYCKQSSAKRRTCELTDAGRSFVCTGRAKGLALCLVGHQSRRVLLSKIRYPTRLSLGVRSRRFLVRVWSLLCRSVIV